MSTWASTLDRRTLFGYFLVFAAMGWSLDLISSLVNYSMFGLGVELNPLVRPILVANPLLALVWLFLIPVFLVLYGYSIWRAADPGDRPWQVNTALVMLVIVGLAHTAVGLLNVASLLLAG